MEYVALVVFIIWVGAILYSIIFQGNNNKDPWG